MSRGLWLLFLAAMAAGCARAPGARYDNPMAVAGADKEAVEQVTRRVLLELGFEVVFPQAQPGHLETEPVTGASWFEFWRQDTLGCRQRLESSLHTVRRRAAIVVKEAGAGSEVSVKVFKERLSAPGSGPTSVTETFDLYELDERSELRRFDELSPAAYGWLTMGRDEALEQRILERIQTYLGSGARP